MDAREALIEMDAREALTLDWDRAVEVIAAFIREQMDGMGRDEALLGLSGGLDSSVAAALTVEALGPGRVKGLILPERDSDPRSAEHALALAGRLGIPAQERDISGALQKMGVYDFVPPGAPRFLAAFDRLVRLIPRDFQARYVRGLFDSLSEHAGGNLFLANLQGAPDPVIRQGIAFIRAKVRARMVMLYLHAERENRLLVGTSNRTEWLVGFFVPQGDGAADAMPLLDLYKTQVRALAQHLDVPRSIIDKPPSPDVAPGVTDERALGLPFEGLDLILDGIERGLSDEALVARAGVEPGQVARVRRIHQASAHMRRLPPHPRVRSVAAARPG